jgi:hypothetical protein
MHDLRLQTLRAFLLDLTTQLGQRAAGQWTQADELIHCYSKPLKVIMLTPYLSEKVLSWHPDKHSRCVESSLQANLLSLCVLMYFEPHPSDTPPFFSCASCSDDHPFNFL